MASPARPRGSAKRRLKRAQGLIREAVAELAADDADRIGELELRTPAALGRATEYLGLALEAYGPVRLVVLRAGPPPPRDPHGAERREGAPPA